MEIFSNFMNTSTLFLASFSIAFLLIQAVNCPLAIAVLIRSFMQKFRMGLLVLTSILGGYLVEYSNTTLPIPSYEYSDAVLMLPGQVPLGVIMSWGLILYTLFMTARYLALPKIVAAMFVALLGTVLNMVTEPTFLELEFWSWLPLPGGWYGIPWDNSTGWYLLVLCLIGFNLYFWEKIPPGSKGWKWDLLAGLLPSILTAPIYVGVMTLYERYFRPEGQPAISQVPFIIGLFSVSLIVVLLFAKRSNIKNALDPWVLATPTMLYTVSLLTLIFSDETTKYPDMVYTIPLLTLVGVLAFLWPYYYKLGIFGPKPTSAPLWMGWLAVVFYVMLVVLATLTLVLPKNTLIGPVELPRDDAWMPKQRFQWWYWTGHLTDEDKKEYGFQLTFFAMNSGFSKNQLSQAALTDVAGNNFVFQEKIILRSPEEVKDGFKLTSGKKEHMTAVGGNGKDTLHFDINGKILDLQLEQTKTPTLNYAGNAHPYRFGGFTYYYSRPSMKATGTLQIGGKTLKVTGTSWFDRQYGELLQAINQGWQWFGIELADNRQLMLFDIKGENTETIGTLVEPDGSTRTLFPKDFQVKQLGEWKSPMTDCVYPSGWEITVGSDTYTVQPVVKNQELRSDHKLWAGPIYWEGAASVTGATNGKAYVELNGFCKTPKPIRPSN